MTETHVVAKVLLVHKSGDVLILRRSKSDVRRPGQGDLPGGWTDEGEDFIAAAVRETEEEAGIKINSTDLQLVYTHTAMVKDRNVCWLFFIGHTDKSKVVLSPEHDKADWMSLDQAIEHIQYDIQQDFLIYVRDNNLI